MTALLSRKDYDTTLMLLSDSITGTLFTIHVADQVTANAHKLFHRASPATRSLLYSLIPARCSTMSLLSVAQ